MCSVQVPILNVESKDYTMWKDKEGNLKRFSVKRAWQDLRQEGNDVPWLDVWMNHCNCECVKSAVEANSQDHKEGFLLGDMVECQPTDDACFSVPNFRSQLEEKLKFAR
ncbi:hypothetical protein Tco_1000396 [Tanacetum coccineum]